MSTRWNRVRYGERVLFDLGVMADGTLYNPNGYPEADVRAAVQGAEDRRHTRRSDAAKRAAITRRRRQEKRTYEVARQIIANRVYGPREHCVICGKALGDRESIERGIGSECWQRVLELISQFKSEVQTAS